MKVICIGGTGRCGTNLLKEILSKHPDVYALPFEHRITVDPDGIYDFYRQCKTSWTPYLMDVRLRRLEALLNNKYEGWELEKWFPKYKSRVKELFKELCEFRYAGEWPGNRTGIIYYAGPASMKPLLRSTLMRFLKDIIGDLLISKNKSVFVEDNTWNILYIDEILELMPSYVKIVHIHRNPRKVIDSFTRQRWMPSDKEQASRIFLDLFAKICLKNSGVYELSFESL
jgi:hypothetical protein